MDADGCAARGTVVLVHGLWMNRWVMWPLARRLHAAGYAVSLFDYASTRLPFAAHVEALTAHAAALQGPLHWVGHSLGGVLVWQTLRRLSPCEDVRAVLLGAPLRGSSGARQLMRRAWGQRFVGASGALWGAFPPLQPVAGACIGAIAGTQRFGIGRLFADLPAPNDGVVTVDETRLAGLADHIVVPHGHTGMLFARPVTAQIAHFLRAGAFVR